MRTPKVRGPNSARQQSLEIRLPWTIKPVLGTIEQSPFSLFSKKKKSRFSTFWLLNCVCFYACLRLRSFPTRVITVFYWPISNGVLIVVKINTYTRLLIIIRNKVEINRWPQTLVSNKCINIWILTARKRNLKNITKIYFRIITKVTVTWRIIDNIV